MGRFVLCRPGADSAIDGYSFRVTAQGRKTLHLVGAPDRTS